MKTRVLLLSFLAAASAALGASAPRPGGQLGVAVNPSGIVSFLRVNASGALMLAAVTPGASGTPGGNVGVALDPDGRVAFLNVDANGALITTGAAASGSITTSGLTMNTARMLGRTTASSGAIEEMTAAAVKTFLSLNNVENTALSTWAGSTSVTTLGTVATGTWSATAIGPTKGGTGLSAYVLGDVLYASAANTLSALAGNTSATMAVLTQTGNGSVSAAPAWVTTTGTGSVVRATSPTITTAATITTTAVGTAQIAGLTLENTTAAAAGAQQWSPMAVFSGNGWKTNATAASQRVDVALQLQPVQAAAAPTGILKIMTQVNAGGYSDVLQVYTTGHILTSTRGGSSAPAINIFGDGNGIYGFNGTTLGLSEGGANAATLTSTNATFVGSVTTGAQTAGSAAATKFGGLVSGAALVVSTTQGIRINSAGTDYTVAILTTNP